MKIPVQWADSVREGTRSVYRPPSPWSQQKFFAQGYPLGAPSQSYLTSIGADGLEGEQTPRSGIESAGASGLPSVSVHEYDSNMIDKVALLSPFLSQTVSQALRAARRLGVDTRTWRFSAPVAMIFSLILLPFLVALFVSGDDDRLHTMEITARKVFVAMVSMNTSEDFWAVHVVLAHDGTTSSVDIPATFQSRLNAELAPLMRKHANEIWNGNEHPRLRCSPPEVQIVSFSIRKSSRLPAICTLEEEHRNKSIRDIRDLRVTYPSQSSRYLMRVKIAEDRSSLADVDDSPRRYHSWGRFRGRFGIDLSDTAKLALQRYCGESDSDVDIEPLDASDVLLITVLELKRLHSLWTVGVPKNPTERASDSLFRAVVSPLDLSPAHSSPIHALRESFRNQLYQENVASPRADSTPRREH